MQVRGKNLTKKYGLSKNQIAAQGAIKFMSAVIIVAVVLYAEIMYLQIISSAFPDGIFRGLATIGAVASGLSVLALVLGKMYWFPPGGQTIWAWCFTGMEVLVLILNLLLSFEIHWGKVDSYMAVWRDFSPATPVIALVGWVIIWQLDSSTKSRHALIEQEQNELEAEIDYRGEVHGAVMDLKHNYLIQTVENLKYEFSSPDVQRQLQQGARDLAANVLSEFTNIPVAPRPPSRPALPSGQTVEAGAGSGARQNGQGLPAARQYQTRQEAQEGEQGEKRGFLGAIKDVFTRANENQPQQVEQEPEQLEPAPVVSRPAPAPRRVVVHPEPSAVAERRRLRRERMRQRPAPGQEQEPETEPLAAAPVAEPAPVEVGEGEQVRKRPKKKLPPMRH